MMILRRLCSSSEWIHSEDEGHPFQNDPILRMLRISLFSEDHAHPQNESILRMRAAHSRMIPFSECSEYSYSQKTILILRMILF